MNINKYLTLYAEIKALCSEKSIKEARKIVEYIFDIVEDEI